MLVATAARADERSLDPARKEKSPFNRGVVMKTLGGLQFWGDLAFFRGWRIQQNVQTGHYRLLDPDNYRHENGTLDACRRRLAEIRRQRRLPGMSGKAVVVVHGIVRSSKSFNAMNRRLRDDGYMIVGFDYPSTRVKISESAEFLHQVLESLDGIDEINFVVHSMGGLLVRSYLSSHHDERIHRMVMLGVPNMGARMADTFRDNVVFKTIFGPAGQQLVTEPDGFIKSLPTPEFEFGVIAGGRGNRHGYNLLIPGDDDATVSVASTRLPGASDFLLVNAMHSLMMFNRNVIEGTSLYLRTGHFRENGEPHPIPRPDDDPTPDAE